MSQLSPVIEFLGPYFFLHLVFLFEQLLLLIIVVNVDSGGHLLIFMSIIMVLVHRLISRRLKNCQGSNHSAKSFMVSLQILGSEQYRAYYCGVCHLLQEKSSVLLCAIYEFKLLIMLYSSRLIFLVLLYKIFLHLNRPQFLG